MEKGQAVTQGLFSSSHLEEFAADSSCVASTGGAQQECAGTAASAGTLLPLHRSPCQAHFVTLNEAEGLRDFHVQQNIREATQNIFNLSGEMSLSAQFTCPGELKWRRMESHLRRC